MTAVMSTHELWHRLLEVEHRLNESKNESDHVNVDIRYLQHLSLEVGAEQKQYTMLIMGTMIFLMQCGFAFLEAGFVRSKNVTNILLKNFIDLNIAAMCFWVCGWALAFGSPSLSFIGLGEFFLIGIKDDQMSRFFVHILFVANAVTIVSGALAERCQVAAYCLYCIPISVFIYPPVAHWIWHPKGWLRNGPGELMFKDFAGSGGVHLVGGLCAVVGSCMIGSRLGRWNKDGTRSPDLKGHSVPVGCSKNQKSDVVETFEKKTQQPGHDVPQKLAMVKEKRESLKFAMLGALLLMFGFFAFNGVTAVDSQGHKGGEVMAHCMVNTLMAASTATLVAIILEIKLKHEKWTLSFSLNCALTAMVASSGSSNEVAAWASCLIGAMAAFVYMVVSDLCLIWHIDDPLDASAVHGGGGLLGLVIIPFLSVKTGILYHPLSLLPYLDLLWQLLGTTAIVLWTLLVIIPTFYLLKRFNLLRVSAEIEKSGLDMAHHGEPAYPLTAYGHGWTEDTFAQEELDRIKEISKMGLGHGLGLSTLRGFGYRGRKSYAGLSSHGSIGDTLKAGGEAELEEAVNTKSEVLLFEDEGYTYCSILDELQTEAEKAQREHIRRMLQLREKKHGDEFVEVEAIKFENQDQPLDNYLTVKFADRAETADGENLDEIKVTTGEPEKCDFIGSPIVINAHPPDTNTSTSDETSTEDNRQTCSKESGSVLNDTETILIDAPTEIEEKKDETFKIAGLHTFSLSEQSNGDGGNCDSELNGTEMKYEIVEEPIEDDPNARFQIAGLDLYKKRQKRKSQHSVHFEDRHGQQQNGEIIQNGHEPEPSRHKSGT